MSGVAPTAGEVALVERVLAVLFDADAAAKQRQVRAARRDAVIDPQTGQVTVVATTDAITPAYLRDWFDRPKRDWFGRVVTDEAGNRSWVGADE